MDAVSPSPALPRAALPDETPLAMPVQSLASAPARPLRPATAPRGLLLRRLFVIGGAVLMTAGGGVEMYRVLNSNGPSILGILVLLLFVALFAWVALAFMSAVGGFVAALSGGGLGLGITRDGPLPELSSRTALLMPTYNESPERVMGGVLAHAPIPRRHRARRAVRHLHPQRHDGPRYLDRGGSRLPGAPRAAPGIAAAASSIAAGRRTPSARRATSPNGCAASAAPIRRC